jgi:hypothetical protein
MHFEGSVLGGLVIFLVDLLVRMSNLKALNVGSVSIKHRNPACIR